MRIHAGFEIAYDCPAPTPMLLALSVHPSRRDDLETPDWLRTDPNLEVRQYLDAYGNICSRILAPAGRTTLSGDFIIRDSGQVDAYAPDAAQIPAELRVPAQHLEAQEQDHQARAGGEFRLLAGPGAGRAGHLRRPHAG